MRKISKILKMRKNIKSVVCVAAILAMSVALQGCAHSTTQDGDTAQSLAVESQSQDALNENESFAADENAGENQSDDTNQEETSGINTDINSEGDVMTDANSENNANSEEMLQKLHVEGTQLVDTSNQSVVLKGISTHGLAWFPQYVNDACFEQLHDEWQANVIRLAMYTEDYNGYCSGGSQSGLKQLILDGVSYAKKAGMYVIVDWHILSDCNPNTHVEEAKAFFNEISSMLSNETHVLYEICNEPNNGTSWEDIKAYALKVIPVIRKNAPDAVIIVGTPNWSQDVDIAAQNPITEYDNIMYSLHFYAATHKDDLRSKLESAYDKGLPVFVTEFGICDASGNGQIDVTQANLWMDMLDKYQISRVAWNLSNKDEASAILKSNCDKTSGFTADDLSDAGQWVYEMLK